MEENAEPRRRGLGAGVARNPDFAEMLMRLPDWEDRITTMLEEHAANPATHRITHTLQVTSYGGSGTTALSRHFADAGLDLPKSPDHWPYKHARVPPSAVEVPSGFRVVYVYSDPREAVLSLFRRNMQRGAYQMFNLTQPSPTVEERLATVEDFARAGIDDFRFEQHFDAWLGHPSGYPVLFLRFDELQDVWPEVRDFVGLPASYPCLEQRARRKPLSDVEPATVEGLTAIYTRLLDRIELLPPVQLVV